MALRPLVAVTIVIKAGRTFVAVNSVKYVRHTSDGPAKLENELL